MRPVLTPLDGTGIIDTEELVDLAVSTAKIAAQAVITAKLADLGVTTGKLADDSVDDTKVGNRVPQFYRRQGGSATDWSDSGTTDRTPGAVRMQGGVEAGPALAGSGTALGSESVSFPTAFSASPLVYVTIQNSGGALNPLDTAAVSVRSVTASGFVISYDLVANDGGQIDFVWLAIGAE